MDLNLKLTGCYRGELEEAKADQARVLYIQVVTLLLSAVAIFVPDATYALSVLAIGSTFAWNWINTRGARKKSTAERARRALMLTSGLAHHLSGKEIGDIFEAFTVSEKEAEKWRDPNYFDAAEPPGPMRLARIMQQSAFWSRLLYKESAKTVWLRVTVAIAVTTASLFFLPLYSSPKFFVQVAQTVCVGLTLFVTRDLIGKAISYGESANALDQIDERLERTIASNPSEADVFSIFGDYNSIVECAPLISSDVYRKHNLHIEELWAARKGQRPASATQTASP